jgi:alpha-D-ribose 1-methylphosphonate 5-triphosphate synthase subunit PhnG
MDGVGAGDFGGGDDRGDIEVALARCGGTDADVVVGIADVERVAVGLGMDSDGLQAHFLAGQDDAQRDLAAVGDEDFRDCRHRSRYDSFTAKSFSPYSMGCPFCG